MPTGRRHGKSVPHPGDISSNTGFSDASSVSLLDVEKYPMGDLRSDWRRWSRAERVSAVALIAAFIICGSSIVG